MALNQRSAEASWLSKSSARRARSEFPSAVPEEEAPQTPPVGECSKPVTDDTVVFDAAVKVTPRERKSAPKTEDFSLSFDDNGAAPASYAPDADYAPQEQAEEEQKIPDFSALLSEEGPSPSPAPVPEPEAQPEADGPEPEAGADSGIESEIELNENGEFPSFAQYVSSLITGTLYRLRSGNEIK